MNGPYMDNTGGRMNHSHAEPCFKADCREPGILTVIERLKAERDALRAENAAKYEEIASERHCYALLEAERQRLSDANAALKARVERYEDLLLSTHKAISAHRHYYPELASEVHEIRARKEQEASR